MGLAWFLLVLCGGLAGFAYYAAHVAAGLIRAGQYGAAVRWGQLADLWIFPTARYPQTDGRPEYAIRERIRSALRGMSRPDERTAALISLAQPCDLIGMLFEKGERRDAAKRAKEITKSHPIGGAVAKAIEAVKAAVIAAAGS